MVYLASFEFGVLPDCAPPFVLDLATSDERTHVSTPQSRVRVYIFVHACVGRVWHCATHCGVFDAEALMELW